jgi:hypothetical protein
MGLLDRLQASGFAGLAGTEVTVRTPIAAQLINEAIAEWLPPHGKIRAIDVQPKAGDRIAVRVRLSASMLPPVGLTLAIDRQPQLPSSPVLVLRMETSGLLSLAGPALRFLDALPPGIRVENDRIYVDLAALLEARGFGQFLKHLEHLNVNSEDGKLIVSALAAVRG